MWRGGRPAVKGPGLCLGARPCGRSAGGVSSQRGGRGLSLLPRRTGILPRARGRFVNAGGGAVFERPLPYPGSGGRVGDALVIADEIAPPPRGAEAFRRPARVVRGACMRGACVRGAWCVRAWCGRAWCACMRHSEGAHAAACSSPGGAAFLCGPRSAPWDTSRLQTS